MIELTHDQQVAQDYKAAMDSVNLINGNKPEFMSDSEWTDTISRNKEHLKIMLAKTWWTEDFDLKPLQKASK